jgi:hypothetical protein
MMSGGGHTPADFLAVHHPALEGAMTPPLRLPVSTFTQASSNQPVELVDFIPEGDAEALTKYVITDMYAKAVQGTSPTDCVKWAEGELKKIYET